jgi:tRNA 5-methylaminomethyl-2-thiouridine biosynthesis bifunctional protein
VAPAAILAGWLGPTIRAEVVGVQRVDGAWRLVDAAGATVVEAEVVCLAAGPHSARLARLGPLRAVRGQVSLAAGTPPAGGAVAWGGYVIPTARGLLFGATHDRDDWDVSVRPDDHARNLAQLAAMRPRLAAAIDPEALEGRAGLRAATPDHMPLAGAVPGQPGLFVLAGLGGRGFTLAPLLAEQVAAAALDAPRPLPRALSMLADPERYRGR